MAVPVTARAGCNRDRLAAYAVRHGHSGSFVDRRNQYVVTRDGTRFLVNLSAEDENSAPITVVLNWDAGRAQ